MPQARCSLLLSHRGFVSDAQEVSDVLLMYGRERFAEAIVRAAIQTSASAAMGRSRWEMMGAFVCIGRLILL